MVVLKLLAGVISAVLLSAVTPAAVSPARTSPPLVLVISVDGFNPASIGRTSTPYLHRLIRQGSSTLNARTAHEQTNTLPNHVGMVTGRRITGTTGHHVTWNYDNGGTIQAAAGHYVASMFDVAHDRGLSTALYTSKDKFKVINRSYDAARGRADKVPPGNGHDKIDTFVLKAPDQLTTSLVRTMISSPRRLTFWHISSPDAAGHAYGFMSPQYLAAVRHTDAMIGRVLRALDARPALKARYRVILTADHGGAGPSHRDPTKYVDYRVPLITWGRGVAHRANLYRLNAGLRKDPARVRRTYAGIQPIRNHDVANLALSSIGLPPVVRYGNMPTLHVR